MHEENILFVADDLHPSDFSVLLAHFARLYTHPDQHSRDIESNIDRIAIDFDVDPSEFRAVLDGREPSDNFLRAFKRIRVYTGVMYSLI